MKKVTSLLIFVLLTTGSIYTSFAQTGSFFGRYAGVIGVNQNSLQRASAFGYNAKVGVSDGLVLGDTLLAKVGIGTAYPKYPLDVRGTINMRAAYNNPALKINDRNFLELDERGEFVLNSFKMKYQHPDQWSDRVFDKNYALMPLSEVADFISQNKHLPNVPSAEEVVKEGVSMGAMVSKLLEKVEELTLYSIQQQKEIEKLKKQVKGMRK
jgi:hypothetical protein